MIIPPGYRFQPTDAELVVHYLGKKLLHQQISCDRVHELNLYDYTPHELFGKGKVSRTAKDGYGCWKKTGAEKPVKDDDGKEVGKKGVLVFCIGKGKGAMKTKYIMHELKDKELDEWVICKIYDREAEAEDKEQEINQAKINTIHLPLPLEQPSPLNFKRPRLNPIDQSDFNSIPHISCQPSPSISKVKHLPIEKPHLELPELSDFSYIPTISGDLFSSKIIVNPSIPSNSTSNATETLEEHNLASLVSSVPSYFNTSPAALPFQSINAIDHTGAITTNVASDFSTSNDLSAQQWRYSRDH